MIRKATLKEIETVAVLANRLWPGQGIEAFEKEMQDLLKREDAAVFLAFSGEEPVGFAQVQLRRDYVEGTSTSPVGYLEGIYVDPSNRRSGLARALVQECEDWAQRHGCTEFASDCELGNDVSRKVHLSLGFQEANRLICFTKKLEAPTHELSETELQFVSELIAKELHFGQEDVIRIVTKYVEWERSKLETRGIDSEDYERDARIADSILNKLRQ